MPRFLLLPVLLLLAACLSPSPPPQPTPRPSASVAPAADVCHVGGITYCALNPAVTDANVKETICNVAWTRGLRPPVSLTNSWKQEILNAYHLSGVLSDYEGDHRMPEAALGGDPGAHLLNGKWVLTDQVEVLPNGDKVPQNFADESPPSPNPKDQAENDLHKAVCIGQMTLTQARTELRDKWLGPYPKYLQ